MDCKILTSKSAPAKLEIVIPKEEVKKEEATESAVSPMKSPDIGSPSSSSSLLKSPGKPAMGLPDQSGLIVGVNTINYDVSFRNKAKTREEKKMEMILKAMATGSFMLPECPQCDCDARNRVVVLTFGW